MALAAKNAACSDVVDQAARLLVLSLRSNVAKL